MSNRVAYLLIGLNFWVQFGCKHGGNYGNNGQNGLVSPCFVDTIDAISPYGHNGLT